MIMNYLIALTLLLTPTYSVKFELFGLSANLLMLWVFLVWLIFVLKLSAQHQWQEFWRYTKTINRKLGALIAVFFAAGIVALFWKGFSIEKLGQFIVLFLQPISLFFIAGFEWQKNPASKNLLTTACYILLATMGGFAVVQYFTLIGLPEAYWGNSVEPKRALGFFTHPNFYALFSTPLLALLIPDVFQNLKSKILNLKSFAWALGALGLLLSLSRAGWLGLGIAGLIYLLFAADKTIKKIASVIVIVMVMVILSVPNLRWRFILPFYGEKSAISRVSLWQTGVKAIKESPILGMGLTGFSQNWNRLNTDPNIDKHNFPHNIFLNFWVETGVIGVIGVIGIMIYKGLTHRTDVFKLGIALFLIALVTQGLIDNPFFKNDLAMMFWIVLSLGL